MAEDKNKKSIIPSDDSDDEYSCDKDSEQQTELSSILDKLSLGPKEEKKKLLVLSLSGLLLHRVHKKDMRKKPRNREPDASCGPNLLYKRPFAEEFMKFCLERFEIGIWSSACERNVDIVLSFILDNLQDKLLFVWDQDECTDSGFKTLANSAKPMFFKDLSKVFKCFKGFSASNTVFIDDEPYKALLNPENTGVFPLSYNASDKNDDFLNPEGKFCSYLDDLAKSRNVQAYIKEHSLGQPMIDSSHPDWSFYRNASKNVS
uniref:Mitochondrial import inner membrane translocase subunit TIM50 n=1 Tax=Noccaea caerulescens TaxID=107243 RepID=A0A1J3FWT0_NOCCA